MSLRTPARYIWPAIIAVVLLVDVGVGVVMMRVANDDPSFAIESDYYAKAVAWDSAAAQARRNTALGWHLSPVLGPIAAGRPSTLTMALTDRDGTPVTGATVTLEAMPVAHAEEVIRSGLPATSAAGDYAASLPMERSGLWELRVMATRGDTQFTADLRLDVSQTADAIVQRDHPWDADPKRLQAGMRPETIPPPKGP